MKFKTTRARIKLRLAKRKKAAKGKARVAGEFWKDVKTYRKHFGGTQKEGMEGVRATPKWVNKRWNRMSKKRREKASEPIGYPEGYKGIKETIIERAMRNAGVTDMNRAKDYWEARGSK